MHSAARPSTIAEVAGRGWAMAERALASAPTPRTLVAHWFVTPDDDSVNVDEDFGGNARTLTFLRVVVPTLADRLEASIVAVAVPWDLDDDGAETRMVLVALMRGGGAMSQARALLRTSSGGRPWWSLGEDLVLVPSAVSSVTDRLRV